CLILIACVSSAFTQDNDVTVSIRNISCTERGRIAFRWTISNLGKQEVYVYSTFLKGPTVSLEFDERLKLLTLWTSRSGEATFGVNAYPEAKFTPLKPGRFLRGHFSDSPKRNPAVTGATGLVFVVAFGHELESVETALREGHYVHPANPIVRWQQVAKSTAA